MSLIKSYKVIVDINKNEKFIPKNVMEEICDFWFQNDVPNNILYEEFLHKRQLLY